MSVKNLILIASAAASLLGALPLRAQDNGALLDLLVRKRIISDQEAEEVRAELTKEYASTSAGKMKLSTPITELELYGDARLRYEVRSGQTARPDTVNSEGDTQQRNRNRYRLRIGLRGTLADDWFFGIRMETSTNPRSTNISFGDDSSTGAFAKTSDGINVGQAYFGYKGIPGVTLTGGKMPNPLVNTLMVWDADINPEGIAEQYKHTFKLSLGGGRSEAAGTSTSKDGKNVAITSATTSEPKIISIDVFANFAQFVYDDSNPENPIGPAPKGLPNTDAYLLAWQVGAKVNFTKDVYLQLAPTLYNYTGAGDTFNTTFVGDPTFLNAKGAKVATNQTGVNNLLVFDLPAEFGWKVGELPMRVFSDFAVNIEGDQRATAAGHPDKGDQRYAYQVGVAVGKLKAKSDWQLSALWQHTEQYSLDPNLVDSDVFDSRVNMEGFAITAGYAITDAITANLTYARGRQIDHDLGTAGIGDIGINPVDKYQLFQADLSVKF
jgi:hypothetical protein